MQSNLKDVIWTVPVAFWQWPAEVGALCWVTWLSSHSCGAAKFWAYGALTSRCIRPSTYGWLKMAPEIHPSSIVVYLQTTFLSVDIFLWLFALRMILNAGDGIQTTSCGCSCCWPQHGRPFRQCLTPLQLNHLLSCLCYTHTHSLTNPSAGHPSARTTSFAYICGNIFNSLYAENSAAAGGRRRHRSTVTTEATLKPFHIFHVVTCNSNTLQQMRLV